MLTPPSSWTKAYVKSTSYPQTYEYAGINVALGRQEIRLDDPEEGSKRRRYGKGNKPLPLLIKNSQSPYSEIPNFSSKPRRSVSNRKMVIPDNNDHGSVRSPRKPAQQDEVFTGTRFISKQNCHNNDEQEHNGLGWVFVPSPIDE